MENKYYTPSIEDIRVGYECEMSSDGHEFFKTIIDLGDISDILEWYRNGLLSLDQLEGVFKTHYLTKEQIRDDGWMPHEVHNSYMFGRFAFEKGNYFLIFDPTQAVPHIEIILRDPIKYDKVFNPEKFHIMISCPSINELRTITKLLGI